MKSRFATATILVMVAASNALGGGVFAPISMDSAAVMPKGVRSVRLAGFTTEILNKYDGYGNIVPLADSFNKGVTWKQLIDSRPSAFERGQLRGGLRAEGLSLDEEAGQAHGLVNTRLTSTIPVIAYGLTDKITLGIGVPIVYSSTNVDTGWSISQLGQQRIDMLMRRGYEGKVLNVKSALNNVVATKIDSYGYKPLENESHTDMGDVTLGAKWQFYHGDRFTWALAPKVVVPTGRTADVDKVVDVAPGDGQFDSGLAVVGDYVANSKITLTGSAGYTYQWESVQAVRVPRTGDELISPDFDRGVREKLGDLWGAGGAVKYAVNDLLVGSLGYSFQYKDEDKFIGSEYEASRYRYLERDTWQSMQAVQIAFTATTVPLYKAGVFELPMDATVSLSHVLDGRNAGKIDLAILEIAAYF